MIRKGLFVLGAALVVLPNVGMAQHDTTINVSSGSNIASSLQNAAANVVGNAVNSAVSNAVNSVVGNTAGSVVSSVLNGNTSGIAQQVVSSFASALAGSGDCSGQQTAGGLPTGVATGSSTNVTGTGGTASTTGGALCQQGNAQGGPTGDPFTLDLDGSGIDLVDINDAEIYFDYGREPGSIRTSWYAPGEYILAIDRSGNGKIDDIEEVFGNWFLSGFEELEIDIDTNNDGLVNKEDPEFADLLIWTDKNGNAISEKGELRPLSDYGVTEINLKDRQLINEYIAGQRVSHSSDFDARGHDDKAYSIWFRVQADDGTIPPKLTEEELRNLAFANRFAVAPNAIESGTGDFAASCDAPVPIMAPGLPCSTSENPAILMCISDGNGDAVPQAQRAIAIQQMNEAVRKAMEETGQTCADVRALAAAAAATVQSAPGPQNRGFIPARF